MYLNVLLIILDYVCHFIKAVTALIMCHVFCKLACFLFCYCWLPTFLIEKWSIINKTDCFCTCLLNTVTEAILDS